MASNSLSDNMPYTGHLSFIAGLMFTSMQGSPGPNINNRLMCLTPDRGHTKSTHVANSITVNPFKTTSLLRRLSSRSIVKAENVKKKRKNFA